MYDKETKKIYKKRHEYNLINSGELRTLPEDEAVIIHFNQNPIIKKIYPYYEVPNFNENANLPFQIDFKNREKSKLLYVPLK
jgi:type IV secretory pathway TraG/TraD family ATPase VirD4